MSQNIDWHFWIGMRTVKLWQGCALVTGLNPDTLRWHPRTWVAGPGSAPLFEGRSFPSAEAKAKFERALRLADNSTSYMNGPIYPQGPLHPGSKAKKEVLLSEVIAFFVSCKWPEIPEALQSLASQPVETPAPVVNEQALSGSNSRLSIYQTPENTAATKQEQIQPLTTPSVNEQALSVSNSRLPITHSTKMRRDLLTPVIELAQTKCRNQFDTAEVWAALLLLANDEQEPLKGMRGKNIMYTTGDEKKDFTRKALGARLARWLARYNPLRPATTR